MVSMLRLLLLFLMTIIAGQSWGLAVTPHDNYQYDVSDIVLNKQNYDYDIASKLGCSGKGQSVESCGEIVIGEAVPVFVDGLFATKSVKPSLSTLHTRGTKIPGGRKIADTLAGSNKIKNSNGDIFKRVDFGPSRPHNGLSPHTHPNFRNQLPDGTIRSGVSRHAGPVTRRDVIDAARQGSQRTGGL